MNISEINARYEELKALGKHDEASKFIDEQFENRMKKVSDIAEDLSQKKPRRTVLQGHGAPDQRVTPCRRLQWAGVSGIWDAEAFGLRQFYVVIHEDHDWTLYTKGAFRHLPTPGYRTLEDATAAAQVDFERRVRASIDGKGAHR